MDEIKSFLKQLRVAVFSQHIVTTLITSRGVMQVLRERHSCSALSGSAFGKDLETSGSCCLKFTSLMIFSISRKNQRKGIISGERVRASHLIRCFPVSRSFYELRHVWVTFGSKSGLLPPTTATLWSTKACQNPKVSFEHPRGLKT